MQQVLKRLRPDSSTALRPATAALLQPARGFAVGQNPQDPRNIQNQQQAERFKHGEDVQMKQEGDKKPFTEKVKDAWHVGKSHAEEALKNMATGTEDMTQGRASMSKVMEEHGEAAKRDVRQMKEELDQVAEGKSPEPKVRQMGHKAGEEVPAPERVVGKGTRTSADKP